MTTFEYDENGRMVRAVTIRESEFTPWDRASLLRDVADSRIPRGSHGLPLAESADPSNQFAFEVEGPQMDWAQKALDDAQAAHRKRNPNAPSTALLWKVRRRSIPALGDSGD